MDDRLKDVIRLGRLIAVLGDLSIDIADAQPTISELVAAGARYELSAYDTEYLLCAARLGLPVATLDRGLAAACERAGVPLI